MKAKKKASKSAHSAAFDECTKSTTQAETAAFPRGSGEQAEDPRKPTGHGARLAALMSERRALLDVLARLDRQIEKVVEEIDSPADVVPTEVERRRARKALDGIYAKIGGR